LVAIKISLFNVKFRFSALTLFQYFILNVFNVKCIFIEKEAQTKKQLGRFLLFKRIVLLIALKVLSVKVDRLVVFFLCEAC
jgi:hypothetical protein